MNKTELVDAVSSKTDLRRSEASKVVDAVFDAIAEALKEGDEVRLFGKFSVTRRKRGQILRARPVAGDIEHSELSREFMARFPKIRAALAR